MKTHHIYGPVPSRRLGRSLGVDVIPFKTCSYDCTYCQLGHTTQHTIERREYVDVDAILAELEEHLARDTPDIISFAGSGEPTLNSGLGRCIAGIKNITDVPVAVFTNASLLWMPEVRRDLALADIVSPSIDAALPATARAVNSPAAGLELGTILQGIREFCAEYAGQIWIEILLARGINTKEEDLAALRAFLQTLARFDKIQLNTVTRPPADKDVQPLTPEELTALGKSLGLPFEIIASWPKAKEDAPKRSATDQDVLDLVRLHPSTVAGIAVGLEITPEEAAAHVASLLSSGAILADKRVDDTYYMVREG